MLWHTTQDIANDLNIEESIVKYTLTQEKVQDYILKSASNKEMQLHLRRIDRADDMLDNLLNRIELFLEDESIPVSKWKDSHVSLIKDVVLNKLPSAINKAIGTAININLGWTTQQATVDNSLSGIINKLEPAHTILFWEIVEKIAQHLKAWRVNIIHDVNKSLDDNIISWDD